MNLALRKATKAGVIDAGQHDEIMALAPKVRANGAGPLDPFGHSAYSAWQRFGLPVAGGLAVIDRRPELYMPREHWLERHCPPLVDPEAYRLTWQLLDLNALEQATAKKGDDG